MQGVTADAVLEKLQQRELDGAETAPVFAVSNGYGMQARNITGYALFDRVDTLVASAAAWKRLSTGQQAAVRAAARDTTAFSATLARRDDRDLAQLCDSGVKVTVPTLAQLRAIAATTEPVRASLLRAPATAPILKELERTDGAGPQLLPVPKSCQAGGPQQAASAHATPATIPDGTYVVRTTVADFHRYGQYGPDWEKPVVWTNVIKGGRWHGFQKPDYPDAGPGSGTLTVHGDIARFRIFKPAVDANPPWTVRWSYYKGKLSFELIDVADTGLRVIFGAHPWRKVR
jgi:hypothetical protein